jgi:hypothetical protein
MLSLALVVFRLKEDIKELLFHLPGAARGKEDSYIFFCSVTSFCQDIDIKGLFKVHTFLWRPLYF